MAKKLFGGVRTQLVGTLVAAVGSLALTACNNGCGTGPMVYKKPCCAQSGGSTSYGPSYAPAYGPGTAAPAAPRPAAPQMACGAGKCA